MKKIFALLLAVVMTLSLAACGEKEETTKSKLDQIKEAGVLVLGTSADYPPAEFHMEIDGKDTIVGYDIELAKLIAEDLGVELKVVDMAFDGLCISLSKGDFDMVISGMSATEERKKAVDFTEPYFKPEFQVVMVLNENADKYSTVDDLKGKSIGYQSGTIQAGVLEEYDLLGNAVALSSTQNIVMELKEGKLDAAYIDYLPSLAFATANPEISLIDVGLVDDNPGEAIAVQKGNEDFVNYLNEIVTTLKSEGKVEQLMAEAQLLAGVE